MRQCLSNDCEDVIEFLGPPENVHLPFFAYGAFKVDELAHPQIESFLSPDNPPIAATAKGALLVRDGLPLFQKDGRDSIRGSLLRFASNQRDLAYQTICRFEPKHIYSWAEITVGSEKANVLCGRKLTSGNPVVFESNEWTFRSDPVFSDGVAVVEQIADELAGAPFESSPRDLDWNRYFRLQAAYLLLWTVIERFCSFSYGPQLGAMRKIKALDLEPRFRAAFREKVREKKQIFDSRNPETRIKVDPELVDPNDPKSKCRAAEYYYQVRNNLSHRGKGAWHDGELVRNSLQELLEIFKSLLPAEENFPMPMKNPPHPGGFVLRQCIEPLGLTITAAAAALGVTRTSLSELVNERRGISPEMAIRLSQVFGGSAESWLTQQAHYDLAQIPADRIKLKRFQVA